MTLAEILASIEPGPHGWHTQIPTTWMQGRTSYGGFSSALAHHCARLTVPDAPPLRSAQIAFAGPMAGPVEIRCDLVRRGRNTVFVETRILCDGGVGFLATFIFVNPRESTLDYEGVEAPDFGPPPAESETRSGPPQFFTHNLDYAGKRFALRQNTPELIDWHRIRERDGLDSMSELLCIGDALPPAAMGLTSENGNISSMNWQVNLLTTDPQTDNGWWLLSARTHHAHHGASSQYMTVWNSRMEPVMTGMQSVALFF